MIFNPDMSRKQALITTVFMVVLITALLSSIVNLIGCVTTPPKGGEDQLHEMLIRKWRCGDGKLYQADRIGATNEMIEEFCKTRKGVKSYDR